MVYKQLAGNRTGYAGLATIAVYLLVVWCCQAPGGEAPRGWEQLHLTETTIAGTKVYYESALEPNLPAFEQQLIKFAADREKLAAILPKRQEIIADINRILGATDPNIEGQDKTFMQIAGLFSQMKMTFYLVRQATIKDFLRAGGRLPNFSYDRASDTATYSPQIHVPAGEKPPADYDFCIPVAPNEDLGAYTSSILGGLGNLVGSGIANVATHEVTELALFQRARPADPYWRWFTDGFANAITCVLIEKHIGKDVARRFADGYDPNDCRDREKQINLRYWMLGNYSAYVSQVPVQAESRIQQARYTCSMLEARRLIDMHKIDCVRQILDKIAARDTRTSADLLQVIREVTGEDMEQRLMRYQAFSTLEEGLREYTPVFNAASDKKDYEQVFVALMRIMELKGSGFSPDTVKMFVNAAMLLSKTGHEEAADQVMQNCMELCTKRLPERGRVVANEAFATYALFSNRPHKARQAAEELLQLNPGHTLALTVKMAIAFQDGNLTQAKEYAAQVRSTANEGSEPYRMASNILALDPNQPPAYKRPAEQK